LHETIAEKSTGRLQRKTARAAQTTGRNTPDQLIALDTKITNGGGTLKQAKILA
jgi:hypothetical protein